MNKFTIFQVKFLLTWCRFNIFLNKKIGNFNDILIRRLYLLLELEEIGA